MWLLVAVGAALATDWTSGLAAATSDARLHAYRGAAAALPAAEALEVLAASLATEDDPYVRAAGQDALARLALSDEELATALRTSPHAIARAWAAFSLGHRPGDLALPALLDAIEEPDDAVRREVYDALGRLGSRDALDALQRAAVSDPTQSGRKRATAAALAVVRARDTTDLETRIALLHGGSREQRVQAAVELGSDDDWRAVDALIDTLANDEPDVQRAAALALGTLGDQRAVPDLLAALAAAPRALRHDLLAALARLGDESALPAVLALTDHEDPTTRQFAVRAASWIGGAAVIDDLVPRVRDPALQVRTELVLMLEGRLTGPDRAPPLAQIASDDPSPFLRAEAARVLIGVGGQTASDALLAALDDRDALVRVTAAEGVATLHLVEAIPSLERLAAGTRKDDERAAYQTALDRLVVSAD